MTFYSSIKWEDKRFAIEKHAPNLEVLIHEHVPKWLLDGGQCRSCTAITSRVFSCNLITGSFWQIFCDFSTMWFCASTMPFLSNIDFCKQKDLLIFTCLSEWDSRSVLSVLLLWFSFIPGPAIDKTSRKASGNAACASFVFLRAFIRFLKKEKQNIWHF